MANPPINTMRDRLAANHHQVAAAASPVQIRRRVHRPVAVPVQADTFRPVPRRVQAVTAYMGVRPGTVSLKVAARNVADLTGVRPERPRRGQPQARIASERDRSSIGEARTPGAHPAIGRSVISPILLTGGSSY